MSTDNSNATRTLSDTEYSKVQGALNTLIGIIGAAEFTSEGHKVEALPPFEKCGVSDYEAALVRTVFAIRAHRKAEERNVMIRAKEGVDGVMHTARLARIEAFREIAALSPMVKEMLGDKAKAPTSTSIPVSDVVSFFPEGMQESDIIKVLHTMNYKLTPGAKKDDIKRIMVHIGEDVVKAHLSAPKATEESK